MVKSKVSAKAKSEYYQKQERARDLAIEWQLNFEKQPHSWWYCIEWRARFERIGKKYGLLREFRENCII